ACEGEVAASPTQDHDIAPSAESVPAALGTNNKSASALATAVKGSAKAGRPAQLACKVSTKQAISGIPDADKESCIATGADRAAAGASGALLAASTRALDLPCPSGPPQALGPVPTASGAKAAAADLATAGPAFAEPSQVLQPASHDASASTTGFSSLQPSRAEESPPDFETPEKDAAKPGRPSKLACQASSTKQAPSGLAACIAARAARSSPGASGTPLAAATRASDLPYTTNNNNSQQQQQNQHQQQQQQQQQQHQQQPPARGP
ncbi:unnamed protein product, partial [Polarella glacialis]